jgi:hypothetical protein
MITGRDIHAKKLALYVTEPDLLALSPNIAIAMVKRDQAGFWIPIRAIQAFR